MRTPTHGYSSYDGKEIIEYDNSKLYPIKLSLSSTHGTISKDTAGLNEKITFQDDYPGLATVSAKAEDAQTDITIDIDGLSFWDLNKTINDNNDTEIILNQSYSYNPEIDSDFIHGIIINRTVRINGNNNTINGLGIARIFHILADNVIINNITFTNAKANGANDKDKCGGAILWNGANGTISRSMFINNNAYEDGGAILWNGTNGTIINSTFNNNTATAYGGHRNRIWRSCHMEWCKWYHNQLHIQQQHRKCIWTKSWRSYHMGW